MLQEKMSIDKSESNYSAGSAGFQIDVNGKAVSPEDIWAEFAHRDPQAWNSLQENATTSLKESLD